MKKAREIREEKWNAYSHSIGIFLGIVGACILLSKQIDNSQLWPIIIYSTSVILLFIASTWYHATKNPILKRKLRILDHISIYYLIAGTYTPVCLWVLNGSKGELLLWLVWGTAFIGTFLKLFFTGKFEVFSLILYGLMGWLIVFDLSFLIKNMDKIGLFYLTLGGIFYTVGMLFYAIKKIRFNHVIWHFFVLGGAVSHWLLINHLMTNQILKQY